MQSASVLSVLVVLAAASCGRDPASDAGPTGDGGRPAAGGAQTTSDGGSKTSGGSTSSGGKGSGGAGSSGNGGRDNVPAGGAGSGGATEPVGPGGAEGQGASSGGGNWASPGGFLKDGRWAPRQHAALRLEPLGSGQGLYNPHRPAAATVKGSGHTHCAPDHSDVDAAHQEERLRDLPGPHAQSFTWMTAHGVVAADPEVTGFLHMFGVETYAKQPSGASPHVLAYLPDGALVDAGKNPFGYFKLDVLAASEAIRKAGGLPVLAHPLRYAIPDAEVQAMDERVWAIEVLSGSSKVEDNLKFIDDWLSSGKYACLTAGGDIHDEDWSLTRGYQVVAVESATPTRKEVFEAVASCNFFACNTSNTKATPVDPPSLRVKKGAIEMTVATSATLRFIGREGAVLAETTGKAASYTPTGAEQYLRVEAVSAGGLARCYSQPLWVVSR